MFLTSSTSLIWNTWGEYSLANRIKQLAEQAWIDTEETFGSFVDEIGEINYTFLHAYDQEFAQLIILDCLEICTGNVTSLW